MFVDRYVPKNQSSNLQNPGSQTPTPPPSHLINFPVSSVMQGSFEIHRGCIILVRPFLHSISLKKKKKKKKYYFLDLIVHGEFKLAAAEPRFHYFFERGRFSQKYFGSDYKYTKMLGY